MEEVAEWDISRKISVTLGPGLHPARSFIYSLSRQRCSAPPVFQPLCWLQGVLRRSSPFVSEGMEVVTIRGSSAA